MKMTDTTFSEALDLAGLISLQEHLVFLASHFVHTSGVIAQTQPADKCRQFHDDVMHALVDAKQTYLLSMQRLDTLFDCLEARAESAVGHTGSIEQLISISCTASAEWLSLHKWLERLVIILQGPERLKMLHPKSR